MSSFANQYRGLNTQSTDNEEEDYPPQFTTLTHEIEKCILEKLNYYFLI